MKKYIIHTFLLLMVLANVSSQAQTIGMRVPDSTVVSGNNIDIPVFADNTLTGNNVLSYVLQLAFNQSYLQVISVITAGTISAAFGAPAVNTSVSGQVTIGGAGTTALTGAGKFIYIRFKALQPGGITINFTGAQNNYFNEGIPAMNFDPGFLNITAPPAITVSPNFGTITKGETLQFGVSGGTAPYQWFVTNSLVSSINATGLLTGTQPGFTKVVSVDDLGLRDTTNGQIEIRAMRLSIPTNLSEWQGSDIDVPVNTTDLTGLNIYSGNLSIGFNQNILTPISVVQTGTLLASYPAPVFNMNIPGEFSMDFAGSSPLTGTGTLIYIRFHVSAVNAGATTINFISGIFNEDMIPNFTNGYFTTINLPVLSITPGSGTLIAGQTIQFTLNGGGAPPIVWSVSDPLIASISQTGLMTTIKGGNVNVTATDVHGASATTGNWVIYDTRVIMPDTTTCPAAGEFYYPVFITSLPAGESVNSVQATVTYNSNYLTFQNLETNGTLTQGWSYVDNPTSGQVIFAGSGATSFNTPGIIILLRFLIQPSFIVGSYAYLQLPGITLNEGIPNPMVDLNGNLISVNPNLPVSISIAASANPVYTGTSVTFTATPENEGTSPSFQWKVNGINSGTNNSIFSYTPVNNDVVTCVLTSNAVCITGNPATSNAVTMTVESVPANIAVTGIVGSGQTKCYSATNVITVAGGATTFMVQGGASVTMIAGQKIEYLPGTRVFAGGQMHGYIDPGGPYCAAPPVTMVAMGNEEIPSSSTKQYFKVFPNPTTGDVTIELDPVWSSGQTIIELFEIQGKKIMSATMKKDEVRHVFSLNANPPGIYFIRVISGNQAETKKVIRQ